ncbi:hypothetical protein OIN60_19910 [Paenibacillus sp. P96]|uniref:Uncharacterized protein n=1 Tax=Paenibacillus zeirhizosphaerae TaxID=2987519 RepID=A0ABT9FWI6_9BACL|nr:hypothetical protein [Paenibacillus sp. P96]MDP4098994.1 hypothetical protein [Paenibacillus sp. P96]
MKQKIAELVPELQGRIFNIQPPEGQQAPFVVLVLGEEIWKSGWAGYRQVVRVRLHGSADDAPLRDEQARRLIDGLHRIPVPVSTADGASTVMFHYLGSREAESADSNSGTTVRALRFGVYVPESQDDALQEAEDEWLGSLANWTKNQLNENWMVYRNQWPADLGSYSILWRMTGYETRLPGASMYEVRKSFSGHVIAPDPASEQGSAILLAERLSAQIQIPLNAAHKRYLSAVEIRADLEADAILEGQLRLTLAQRQIRPVQEAALIRRVEMQPILK